jgi:hypothetical protein
MIIQFNKKEALLFLRKSNYNTICERVIDFTFIKFILS